MALPQTAPRLAVTEMGRRKMMVEAESHETLSRMRRLIEGVQAEGERMSEMIDSLLPSIDVPGEAVVLQARRNAQERKNLLEEFGALTSSEVADLAHSKASNRAALANRWRKEGWIFAVEHRGRSYFPAFQFDDEGHPLSAIAEILEIFGGREGWETALWFSAASGWLGGRRPVDLLESDPEKVVDAARSAVDSRVF